MAASAAEVQIVLTSLPGQGQYLVIEPETPLQALLDETPHTPLILQDLLRKGSITWQYRNETSIAHAMRGDKPAIPFLTGLAAWDSEVLLEEGKSVSVRDYFSRRRGGSVQGLRIPVARQNRSTGVAQVSITPSDHPIVLAVAMLEWDGETITAAGLAIHGVSKQGVLVIPEIETWAGTSQPDAAALAEQAAAHFAPRSDFRASAEYRHEMGKVVIRRALEQALTGEKA